MPKREETEPGGSAAVSIEDIRSWWKVPAIAHFCSLFRSTFALPDYEIEDLEEALFLDAGQEPVPFLPDLLVALLKGCFARKDITPGNHHQCLQKFMKRQWELVEGRVNPLNLEDATFKGLPTLIKVEILHSLCDFRLDAADVTLLKEYHGEQLRVEPLGVDSKGAKYWYFYSTRLYKEDPTQSVEEKEAKRKKMEKEKIKKKKEKEVARKKRLQETVKARKALEKRLAKKKPSKAKKLMKPLKSDNETCSDDNIPLRQLCKKKAEECKKEDTPSGRGKGKRKMEAEEEKIEEPEELNKNGKRKKKMPVKKTAKKVKKEEVKKEEQGSDADSESEEDDNLKSKKKKKEKKTRKMIIKKEELETETECDEEEDKKRRKPSSPRGKGRKKEEVSMDTSQEESDVGKKGRSGKGKKRKGLKKMKEETATSAESEMDMAEAKSKKGKGAGKKKRKKKGEESQEETDAEPKKGKKIKKRKGLKKGKDTATESEACDGDEGKEELKGKGKKKSKLQKLKKESSVDLQSGSDLDSKTRKKLKAKKKKVKTDASSQDESQEDRSQSKPKIKQEMKDLTENEEPGDGKIKKKRRKKKEIKSKEIITATESDTEAEPETSKPGQGNKKGQRTTSPGRVTRRGTPTKAEKEQAQKDKNKDKGTMLKGKKAVKGKAKNVLDASSQSEDDNGLKSKKGSKAGQKTAKQTLKKSSKKSGNDGSQDSQEEGCETEESTVSPSKKLAKGGQASKATKGNKASRKSGQDDESGCREESTSLDSLAKKGRTAPSGKKQTPAKKSSKAPAEQSDLDEREALKELQSLLLMESMLKVASDDSSSDTSSEEEPETARWHLICHTEEDWERLTESFKRVRNKAERALYLVLKEDFLSEIHNIFAAKERALRRKLQEMIPRRSSGRIADIKVRQEEEENMKSLAEFEEAQKKEAEEAVRKISLRRRNRRQGEYTEEVEEEEDEEDEEEEEEGEEEEDEETEKEEEEDEETEKEEEGDEEQTEKKEEQQRAEQGLRARLRAKNASPEPSSDDPTSTSSVPYDLGFGRTTRSSRSQVQAEQEKEKLKKSFAKVLDTTKTHYEAWPFIDPVQESYAPNYYSIIKVPMDIATMDLKVEERMYHSINDFVNDMDLIFQNCVQYNGRKSEYTLMARKVEACFRRALKKQFPNFRKKNANCHHPVPKPVFTDSQDEGETDSQSSLENRTANRFSKKEMGPKEEDEDQLEEEEEEEEDEEEEKEEEEKEEEKVEEQEGKEQEKKEDGGCEERVAISSDPSPCPSPASYHSEDYVELKSTKSSHLGAPKKWKEDDDDGDDEEEDDDDDIAEIDKPSGKSIVEKQSSDETKKATSTPPKGELILSEDEDSIKKCDKTNALKEGSISGAISGSGMPEKTSWTDQRPGPSYMPMSSTRYIDNIDKPRAHVPPMVATPLRQSSSANVSHQPKPLQVSNSEEDKNRLQSPASNDKRKAQFSPTSKTSREPAVQEISGQSIADRGVGKTVYSGDQLLQKGVVHHGVVQGPEPLAVQPIIERNTAVQPNRSSYQEMIDLNARRPPPLQQSPWYNTHSEQSNKSSGATQAVPPLIQDGAGTQGTMLQQPPTSGTTEQRTHEIIPMPHSEDMQQRPLQAHSQNHPQGNSQSHLQSHHPQSHPQSHSQGHPHSHPHSHPQSHPHSQPHSHPQSHSQVHPQSHISYAGSHGMGRPLETTGTPSQWGVPSREVEPFPAKLWRPLAVDSPSVPSQGQTSQMHKAQSPPQYPQTTLSISQPSAAPSQSAQPQGAPMSETMQRLASQGSPNAHHGSSTTATELLRSMASPPQVAANPTRPSQDVSNPSSTQSNPLSDNTSRPSSSFKLPSHSPMPNAIPPGYPGYMSMQRVPTPGMPPHLGTPVPGLDPNSYPGYSGQVVPSRKDGLFDPMRTGHTSPFPTTTGPKPDIFNATGRLTPGAGIHPSLSSHRSSAFNQPQTSALYASQLHTIPASQTLPSSYPGLSSPSHLRSLLQGRQGSIPDPMARVGQSDVGMLQRNPYLDQSAYGTAPGIDPRYSPMYSQQYNPCMTQQPMGSSVPYPVGSSNSYFPGQAPHPQSYHSLNPSHVPPGYRR